MAPPPVSAARRAPRRARRRPLTASWCRWAPRRPRPVSMPQLASATTSSKSCAGQRRRRARRARVMAHSGLDVALVGGGHLGHELLGQHVERGHRRLEQVEPALAHGGQQGGALDQLVAGRRVEAAGRRAVAVVVGPADPLEEGADGAGRADLADQLDRADVDARARATPWPPARAGRRHAAASRRCAGAPPRGCRGARPPAATRRRRRRRGRARRRPGARPAGGPPARPSCAC